MDKFASSGAALADFAIRRPVTILMSFLSMLLFGILSSQLLPLEKFPSIDIPEIAIRIPYKDATPLEVEKMITRPVEETLATMSGIKRLRSRSFEDAAEIQLEFAWDENLKAKGIEAREKIDAIRAELPADVERILVYQFNTNDMPIFSLRVSSQRDLSNAFDLLERNLKRPIERVAGVSKVELYGVDKKQISIRLDSQLMASLQIDTNTLAKALRSANFSLTAGTFIDKDYQQKITVTPQGQFNSVQQIRDLQINKNVKLSDIALVRFEKPERTDGRHLDQAYAVGFNIYRESNSNMVEVSEQVLKVIEEANSNPAFNGIHLFIMENEAESVTESLADLLNAGLIGALLSLIVLYAFLRNITTTLLVVLSVPFSICITLGCMYMMGYSINILSMMGLMLAVGMLVDNAVVVTESIQQEKQQIADPILATKVGVGKVSLAVIAGTITTAIVFLPNIVGEKVNVTVFLEHVAIAICISLFASLLISQTLIPLLSTKIKGKGTTTQPIQKAPNNLARFYQKILTWTLRHQGKTSLIALAILASTAIPMQYVTSDEDRDNDQNRVWMNYDIQGSYSLEEVEKAVNKMEAYLYANQQQLHIKQVYSYYTTGFAVSGITFIDDLPVSQSSIKQQITDNMPRLARARPSFQWNKDNAGNVKFTLVGDSSETLNQISKQVIPVLSNLAGMTDVKTDTKQQKKELQVVVDRQKAFRYGLTSHDIAQMLAVALRGTNLRTFRHQDSGEIGIKLMFDKSLQNSVEQLKNLTITRKENQNITLDMLANLTVTPRLAEIRRSYRQTSITIGANLQDGVTLQQAQANIEGVMKHIQLPTGYAWTFDDSIKRQKQNESAMQTNMLLAICMIYIVMAALFESLLLPTAVITSLLFSMTGVFWALFAANLPMSIMAMIGMLILMGIVVNNGIVLVDRINQLIYLGQNVQQAIIQACLTRVKPILMTVATTVLGLVPLAMGSTRIGGDGPPYAPMAIAIVGGLVFSTLTSLVLVPLAYLLLLKLRAKTQHMLNHSRVLVNRVIR
ncbi:efflux RND transporter permease subunit [Paraglaciecola aquimarina]|uniref:Efflux RND transporter permease subunit n=1 Tax=Paraglaciecola aquimarina TaxID=1235557 RepID=A0ABU3SZ97_9ALTE|nr:efflux RND transporter permease subunit [Paraglaciecola aquimarina]MDU0355323.1 efflux RND transporter permease subunit [Paraglaciecola aquimarina]